MSMSLSQKRLKQLNAAYFTGVLLLALYFGVERAIFCDTSMQLFDMARTGLPSVNVNMSTTVVNFIFPYLGILLGLPLKIIVWLQALNYLLLPVAVFLLLRYRQTTLYYETAFLLSFSLFNSLTFYYPIHDYWTGFYLLFVLYRILDDREWNWSPRYKNRVLYGLILAIIFTHLTMVITMGFLFLFLYVIQRISLSRLLKMYAFMLLILVVKMLFINSGYQNSVLDISALRLTDIIEWYSVPTFAAFWPTLWGINANFLVLGCLSVFFLRFPEYRKPVLLFWLVIAASIGVIYLLFARFGYNVYTEGYFKSLNITAGIIVAYLLFGWWQRNGRVAWLLAGAYLFSLVVLYDGGGVFKRQYDFLKKSGAGFKGTVYLHSSGDICPLECLSVSRQSLIINQLENGKSEAIFSNVRDTRFVAKLNDIWIKQNVEAPVSYFTFGKEVKHLDADSMQFPIDSMFVIFAKDRCDDMLKRLDQ